MPRPSEQPSVPWGEHPTPGHALQRAAQTRPRAVPRRRPWAPTELLAFELTRHLHHEVFPADRRALVRALLECRAPGQLVAAVRALPPREDPYRTVQDVVRALLTDR